MSSFNIDLNRPSPYIENIDVKGYSALGSALSGAAELGKLGLDYHKDYKTKQFQSELEALDASDSASSLDVRERILREMEETVPDEAGQQKLNQLTAALTRIHRAETIRRSDMSGRKKALVKQWLANNPWMSTEIKSVAQSFGVGGGTGKPDDPMAEFLDPMVKEITQKYTPVFGAAAPHYWAKDKRAAAMTAEANDIMTSGVGAIELAASAVTMDLNNRVSTWIQSQTPASGPGVLQATKLVDFSPLISDLESERARIKAQAYGIAASQYGEAFTKADAGVRDTMVKVLQDRIDAEYSTFITLLGQRDDGAMLAEWQAARADEVKTHLTEKFPEIFDILTALGFTGENAHKAFQPILTDLVKIQQQLESGGASEEMQEWLAKQPGIYRDQSYLAEKMREAIDGIRGMKFKTASDVVTFAKNKLEASLRGKGMRVNQYDAVDARLYRLYGGLVNKSPMPTTPDNTPDQTAVNPGLAGLAKAVDVDGEPILIDVTGMERKLTEAELSEVHRNMYNARVTSVGHMQGDDRYRLAEDSKGFLSTLGDAMQNEKNLLGVAQNWDKYTGEEEQAGPGFDRYTQQYAVEFDAASDKFTIKHSAGFMDPRPRITPSARSALRNLNTEYKNRKHLGDWSDMEVNDKNEVVPAKVGKFKDQASFIKYATNTFNRVPASKRGMRLIDDKFVISQDSNGTLFIEKQKMDKGSVDDPQLMVDPADVKAGEKVMQEAEAQAKPVKQAVALDFIAQNENAGKVGRNSITGLWVPHASVEGGSDTLGYGHKLTDDEVRTGKVIINGEAVDYKSGLTDEQINSLLKQDYDTAAAYAARNLQTWERLSQTQQAVVVDALFNLGAGQLKKSKAWKALNAGDWDGWLHEYADKDVGFVKVNDEFSPGLYARRQRAVRLWHYG